MSDLRVRLVRLAHANPEIRPHLLPVLVAKGFPSQQSLEDYLDDHPNAAKEKHWVEEGEGKPEGEGDEAKPEKKDKAEEPEPGGKKTEAPSDEEVEGHLAKFLGKVKGASKAIVDAVKKAPSEVKRLVSDPEARNHALKGVAEGMKKAPGKIAQRVYEGAKKEVKEIKHAGHALGKVVKGEKLDKSDKKAIYAVGVYVAGAALAASGGGALMAAGAVGKSFALHVGIKAVHALLDDGFTHFEAGETLVHGVTHVMEHLHLASESAVARLRRAAEEGDDDALQEALVAQITAYVAKALKDGVSDEEMTSILEGKEAPEDDELDDMPEAKMRKEGSDLRGRIIRLAASFPPGSGERRELLAAVREGASYAGDPRWITVRRPGKDDKGRPVRPGDKALWWPRTKTLMTGPEAEAAWQRFLSESGDEDGMPYARAASDRKARGKADAIVVEHIREQVDPATMKLIGQATSDLWHGPLQEGDEGAEGYPGFSEATRRIRQGLRGVITDLWVDTQVDDVSNSEPVGFTDEETGEFVEPAWEDYVHYRAADVERAFLGKLAEYV